MEFLADLRGKFLILLSGAIITFLCLLLHSNIYLTKQGLTAPQNTTKEVFSESNVYTNLLQSRTGFNTSQGRNPTLLSTRGLFSKSSTSGGLVSNSSNSAGLVSNSSNSAGLVSNSSNSAGPVANSSNSAGPVSNSSNSAGLVSNSSNSAGPVSNSSNSAGLFSNSWTSGGQTSNPWNTRALFSNSSSSFHVQDPSKPVICHTFSPGRLGNHLFEYASVLGMAVRLNKTFAFWNDEDIARVLKYPPVQPQRAKMKERCHNSRRIEERYLCRYDGNLLKQDAGQDYSVGTYLQSWVYFDELRQEMKKAVTFADHIVENATRVIGELRAKFPGFTFVGVHNRRGDLTKRNFVQEGYLTASPEFFTRALTYFRQRFSRVRFIVLGEDVDWNKQNIQAVNDDVIVLTPSSSAAVDIQILALTDHMIRTVGTFGWWAAFKIPGRPTIVYLKDFIRPKSALLRFYSQNAEDYMLPGWIGI